MRQLSTALLWRLGVFDLARTLLSANGRFVLMFHGTPGKHYSDIPQEAQSGLTRSELRQILGWLKSRLTFLDPDGFFSSNNSGVLLTFDDGLASNHSNALPLLEEFEAPAIFFVTLQHVYDPHCWLPAARDLVRKKWAHDEDVPEVIAGDLYNGMSDQQLTACAKHPLITIGSHCVSHPFLTRCDQTQLDDELIRSKRSLSELTGKAVDLLAYPTGDYDVRVARAAGDAGYVAAFAVDPHNVGIPLFEIPRVGIYSSNPAYLSAKLSGLHRRAVKRIPSERSL
jgi:peptidoglycan/xylan/chitin deacetylase (PgdA/CDA1 family)